MRRANMKRFSVNSVFDYRTNLDNLLSAIDRHCILEFDFVAQFKYPDGDVPVYGDGEVTNLDDLYELIRENISDDDADAIFNALVIDDFTIDYIANEYGNLSENVLIDDDSLYFYYSFNIEIV